MKLIYDIECFPEFFFVGFKNYETKEIITFEISKDIDQKEKFYEFLHNIDKNNTFFISFNGLEYDNIVVNYFYKNYKNISTNVSGFETWDWQSITNALKEFSNYVINNKDNFNDNEIKNYKYHNKWIDIDLFRYWSKMTRISRKISLKSLGIQLNHTRVQELPYQHDKILNKEEREKVKDYNLNNDLVILEKLCDRMKSQIIQRQDANVKYGFNCWSWDGVKLGLNILLQEYCKEYGYERNQIDSLRSKLEPIKIERLLSHKISFKKTEEKITTKIEDGKPIYFCNSFFTLYNHLKERIVSSTNELAYSVILNDVKYDIKSGGLHSYHTPEIIQPNLDKFIYRDCDVSSYYPSLGAEYSYVPTHLPGMAKVIKRIKEQRIEFKKKGDKKNAELYKLALNGGYYGNLNSEYTPMYDPKMLLAVTLNGQLFLLMLCEKLIEIGIIIDSVNTDGITCIIPKELENEYEKICKEWEELTLMQLEFEDYKKVIRGNINNYLAIKLNDNIKEKGIWFLTNPELGLSTNALIIAKSLQLYYTKNISIEDSISNPEKYGFTIFDYCYSNKISKDYTVWWNNKLQQNLNRYYISNKNSPYLYKKKKDKTTMENVLKGFGVELFNDYIEKPFKDYNVNINYYISKVREILNELEPIQQKLFLK